MARRINRHKLHGKGHLDIYMQLAEKAPVELVAI